MSVSETKCPNCNGELRFSGDKSKMICKYCDSVFPITQSDDYNSETQYESEEVSAAEKLFDVRLNYLDEKGEKTWQGLCGLINFGNDINDYMQGLDLVAKSQIAIFTKNNGGEILNTAVQNALNALSADEVPLVFENLGLFSKGKDGILITNKSVLRITKKAVNKLLICDINSLNPTASPYTVNKWRLNDKEQFYFGITLDAQAIAIILGLICTLVRDCHSEGYKIIVENQKG